jgi:hypothetical protein
MASLFCSQSLCYYCFPNDFTTHANGPENGVFGAVLQESFSNASAGSEGTHFLY